MLCPQVTSNTSDLPTMKTAKISQANAVNDDTKKQVSPLIFAKGSQTVSSKWDYLQEGVAGGCGDSSHSGHS